MLNRIPIAIRLIMTLTLGSSGSISYGIYVSYISLMLLVTIKTNITLSNFMSVTAWYILFLQ